MTKKLLLSVSTLMSSLLLVSCGGGGGSEGVAPTPLPAPVPVPAPSPAPTPKAAAEATAVNNPLCKAIQPFYWEIGDKTGTLDAASVGTKSDGSQYKSTELMTIASSSKWLYGAYAVEKKGGVLDANNDVPFLNFTSGYSNFNNDDCRNGGTVADCLNGARNDAEAKIGAFHYNAGHLQTHAASNGLGSLENAALAAEIGGLLGGSIKDVPLEYWQPQLAGGGKTTPQAYAAFLRKLLGPAPALKVGGMLGTHAVCTNASVNCNASTPAVIPEAWHYSLGHWVEDDPSTKPNSSVADNDWFAYSSGGALGFYPWVDFPKTLYGIVAREDIGDTREGYASGQCGRLIRLAWKTGVEQK